MPKYNDEIKAKCVEMVQEGVNLAEIHRQLGPNPKAIQRYCEKVGIVIPKRKAEPKPKKEKVKKQ